MKKLLKKWLGITKLESQVSNHNGDIMTIIEKQLAFQGANPHQDMQAVPMDGGLTIMNLGNHAWVCETCGGARIQDCKAGKPHLIK